MIVLKKSDNWLLEERCCNSDCCAKLEINREDIYVIVWQDRNIYKFNYTFKCPCCNIETKIEERLLPSYIKISTLEQLKKKLGLVKNKY